ncbi:MAG: hypothetical protein IPF57_14595 [Gammaproteobacteria bacterium]|nr:hypothetical protein [Gammaproteobacteria bacterium]
MTTTANQTVTYTYDANGNMTGGGGHARLDDLTS